MKDQDIRKVLLEYLGSSTDSITLNEIGICGAKTIVDVLYVKDKIEGFEIKSDSDNLLRLDRQVDDYSRVCDTCTIVVGDKYVKKIAQHIPSWWGIYHVNEEGLTVVRDEKENKNQDRTSVIEMLWKEEAQRILKEHNMYRGMSTFSKKKLFRAIYENVPYGYVHDFILQRMKDRDWRGKKVR